MRWNQMVLSVIILGLVIQIGLRYQENGGMQAPIVSRVHKLETGFRDAIRELEDSHDVTDVKAWVELGEIYSTFALMPEAEYCFRRALKVGDLDLEQQFKFGICLSRRGKLEKAIAILKPVGASAIH